MNAANPSPTQAASDVEIRIFRRGVSDQEVRQAIMLVREYVSTQAHHDGRGIEGWRPFSEFYDDLSRHFTVQQTVDLETATDIILASHGCPRLSTVREGLGGSGGPRG